MLICKTSSSYLFGWHTLITIPILLTMADHPLKCYRIVPERSFLLSSVAISDGHRVVEAGHGREKKDPD